jgi:hypothetical protein
MKGVAWPNVSRLMAYGESAKMAKAAAGYLAWRKYSGETRRKAVTKAAA